MLNAVGWAGAILLATGLLRVILGAGGARAPLAVSQARFAAWRPVELLPLAALVLALWHGWMALQVSPFVVLFALPGYLAAAILVAISRRRLKRASRAARAPGSGGARDGAGGSGAAGSATDASATAGSAETGPVAAGSGAAEPAATVAVGGGLAERAAGALPPWGLAARLTATAGLALLAFSVVRLVQLHLLRSAAHSPPELRRQERPLDLTGRTWPGAFAVLCADLAERYPFTAWKGIDWRERCAATAPRVAAAAASHDAAAWYRALRELAWSIPDGHVGLLGDDHGLAAREAGGDFGLRLVQLGDGRVVAAEVSAAGAAARAGLRYGAEILTWNGLAAGQALARVPVLWADWPPATSEARRAEQLRFLTRGPVGAAAALTYRNRGAARPAAATLTAAGTQPARHARRAAEGPEPAARSDEGPVLFNAREALAGGAVRWRWLSAGAGYIRVLYELPTLRQVDSTGEVRRAVSSFVARRAQGIVLDVRGNGGGLDIMVPRALGCFVSAPGVYEIPGVFNPAAGRFLPDPAHAVRLLPAAPHFSGRVAVLIDGYTMSSGEGFPLALRGRPGVAVFGFAATAGFFAIDQRPIRLPGNLTFVVPIGQSLGPGGRIQVDSDASGRGGVAPDHRLPWTEATLDAVYRDHRDPVLEAALAWLQSTP